MSESGPPDIHKPLPTIQPVTPLPPASTAQDAEAAAAERLDEHYDGYFAHLPDQQSTRIELPDAAEAPLAPDPAAAPPVALHAPEDVIDGPEDPAAPPVDAASQQLQRQRSEIGALISSNDEYGKAINNLNSQVKTLGRNDLMMIAGVGICLLAIVKLQRELAELAGDALEAVEA